MSIKWKDGRGKTVVLDGQRWQHILKRHPEFKDHIEWCQSAVEDAIEIREDPSPGRSPGERYIGPVIERGLFAGMKPVVKEGFALTQRETTIKTLTLVRDYEPAPDALRFYEVAARNLRLIP